MSASDRAEQMYSAYQRVSYLALNGVKTCALHGVYVCLKSNKSIGFHPLGATYRIA